MGVGCTMGLVKMFEFVDVRASRAELVGKLCATAD